MATSLTGVTDEKAFNEYVDSVVEGIYRNDTYDRCTISDVKDLYHALREAMLNSVSQQDQDKLFVNAFKSSLKTSQYWVDVMESFCQEKGEGLKIVYAIEKNNPFLKGLVAVNESQNYLHHLRQKNKKQSDIMQEYLAKNAKADEQIIDKKAEIKVVNPPLDRPDDYEKNGTPSSGLVENTDPTRPPRSYKTPKSPKVPQSSQAAKTPKVPQSSQPVKTPKTSKSLKSIKSILRLSRNQQPEADSNQHSKNKGVTFSGSTKDPTSPIEPTEKIEQTNAKQEFTSPIDPTEKIEQTDAKQENTPPLDYTVPKLTSTSQESVAEGDIPRNILSNVTDPSSPESYFRQITIETPAPDAEPTVEPLRIHTPALPGAPIVMLTDEQVASFEMGKLAEGDLVNVTLEYKNKRFVLFGFCQHSTSCGRKSYT